jgi:flagellum-specific peptidoglycan hydrolase FlgJ
MQRSDIKLRPNNWLFWACVLIAATFSFMIGLGEGYEGAKGEARSAGRDSKVLDEVMSSWIPDRELVSEAGLTATPSNARFGTFPDTVVHLAVMVQDSTGARAPVLLAQWALESGFGRFSLDDHNYFGMHYDAVKKYMTRPAYVIAYDRKLQADGSWKNLPVRFAKFPSTEDCFMVYGKYLAGSSLYRAAFRQRTLKGYVRELSKRYAEDPDYAVKLLAIIDRYNLSRVAGSNREGITK